MPELAGIITAMATPFTPDGAVDEEGAVALATHLLDHGSDGLVVCGTTGEASTLTDDEHLGLIGLIASELGDRTLVIGGTGSNDTRHAVHLTEQAVARGAHAVLSVTPYYNKPNRRGIVAHFSEVAKAAQGTPVVLYNIPGRTAVDMPNDLLAELAQVEGIEGVKQSNTANLAPVDGLALLAGNDEDLAKALDVGGTGGICVSSHLVGEQMRRMVDEPDQRWAIHEELSDVFATLFLTSSPTCTKAALALLGLPSGPLRLPMVEADEAETAAVRAMLERHGLLAATA